MTPVRVKKNVVAIIVLISTYSLFAFRENTSKNNRNAQLLKAVNSLDADLFIVDTIDIDDPIIIKFEDKFIANNITTQLILVSKSSLDSSTASDNINCKYFILSKGYLFFTANDFSCLISNLFYKFPSLEHMPFYDQLKRDIQKSTKDIVWVNFDKLEDKPKKYFGWEYFEIYPRRFLFCLVKGDALRLCQSIDKTIINGMDNVYFKMLVPVTW